MTTYILRRVGQSVVVLFGVTLIVFLLVHMLPGGPAKAMLGPGATLQQIHYFTIENGWNLPVMVQYVHYMERLFHGNLGFSYTYNQSVASLLEDDVPKTALLIGLAYIATMVIAVPIGIAQAIRANTAVDHAITAGAFVAYSMPTFWLSTLLILWFSVSLHLFPSQGPRGTDGSGRFQRPPGFGVAGRQFDGGVGGDVQPLRAVIRHDRPRAGLHTDRPRQRRAALSARAQARTSERAEPNGDVVRDQPSVRDRWGHRGRVCLQLPGYGAIALEGSDQPGLPVIDGFHTGRRHRRRPWEPHRRRAVRSRRPQSAL